MLVEINVPIKTIKGKKLNAKFICVDIESPVDIGNDAYKVHQISISGVKDQDVIEELAIPAKYNGVEIQGIGGMVLSNASIADDFRIKKLLIPDTVSDIEPMAFAQAKLDKVEWSWNCDYIPYKAFQGSSIRTISNIGNVKHIGKAAFDGSGIEEFSGFDSCIMIEEDTFMNCYNLKKVVWPAKCTVIPRSCFFGCSHLTILIGVVKVERIWDNAFCMSGIESIVLPDNCTQIGKTCFESCTHLKTVAWSEKCLNIPDECFLFCDKLEHIKGLKNVVSVGYSAFEGTAFKEFEWPELCSEIPNSCFNGAENLEFIKLPSDIARVGNKAFKGTKLKSVDLSDNISVEIGKNAFPDDTEVLLPFYQS
jgi:hypothetical protein